MGKKPALREAIMDQVWYSFDRTYACLSFRVGNVLLPVWVPGSSAVHLERRLVRPPNRPEGVDLLLDRIEDIGLDKVAITGYSDGVFYATIYLRNGEEIDCRPTDALVMADLIEDTLYIGEDVLCECGLSVDEQTDLFDLFEGTVPLQPQGEHIQFDPSDIDISDDDEFSALMGDLGISESDLKLDLENPDDQ